MALCLQGHPANRTIRAAAIVITTFDQVAADTHTKTTMMIASAVLHRQNPPGLQVESFGMVFAVAFGAFFADFFGIFLVLPPFLLIIDYEFC
jgi:hypothetical protein